MADGSQGYSQNAKKVAAAGGSGGCPACTKAGLPILLTRPGLADGGYAQAHKSAIEPLLKDIAEPELSYLGYVMRTLRKGYVHAYYEKWHTPQIEAQDGWQVFEVDEGGYLTPYPIGAPPPSDDGGFSCDRSAGYAGAMMFAIPDAKNTKRVWVGYSDHPWSEAVRKNYAGDEGLRNQRMTCIDAPNAACKTATPLTEDNVNAIVDYAPDPRSPMKGPAQALAGNPYPRLVPKNAEGTDGPFDPLATIEPIETQQKRGEDASDLRDGAQAVIDAGGGKFTIDDAMIVGVPDPVDVTFEAAYLRVTLCNSACEWVQKYPEDNGHWRLTSAMQIEGLLKLFEKQGKDKKQQSAGFEEYDGATNISKPEFDRMKADGRLPPTATYVDVHTAGYALAQDYVSIPSAKEIDDQTDKRKQDLLANLEKGPRGLTYDGYLDKVNSLAKADADRLAKVEQDYFAWLDSLPRKLVTTHDFDEATPSDGVHYCNCVAKLTYAGHLTALGLELYQHFMQDNPNNPENLFVRALLGNQASNFASFGSVSSIEVLKSASGTFQYLPETAHDSLRYSIQAIIGNMAGVRAALRKMPQGLKDKLSTLIGRVAGESITGEPPAQVKVSIPASQVPGWLREQANMGQRVLQQVSDVVDGRQVKSMMFGGTMMLNVAGAPKSADALVDVYLWVRSAPDNLKAAAQGVDTYLIKPAVANLNKAWQGAENGIRVSAKQLRGLFHEHFEVVRTGTALLATAAGALALWSLYDAWAEYDTLAGEERDLAMYTLLSSGLGAVSALMDIGVALLKETITVGWKFVSGVAASAATLVMAVQSGIKAYSEASESDEDARNAYIAQTALFIGAAGATLGAVLFASAGASVVLALTGIGLVLFLLGVVAGIVALMLQDTPAQEWAAKSIWGDAEDKWGSLKREISEMNQLLLGMNVAFDYRSMGVGDAAQMSVRTNPLTAPSAVATDWLFGDDPALTPTVTREAFCKLVIPEKLQDKLGWAVKVFATRADGQKALVASRKHPSDYTLGKNTGSWVDDRNKVAHTPPEDDDPSTIYLSAQLNTAIYTGAHAEVTIDSTPGTPGGIVVDEKLY